MGAVSPAPRPQPEPAGAARAGDGTPLARLFAIAYRSLIDDLHERLAARGWRNVRQNYGFVLLAARGPGIQASEIAALMGISKQAASKLVEAMEQAGYLRRDPHADDLRAKVVTLTGRGDELLAAVEEIYAELEDEWVAILDRARVDALRCDLTTVLRATHGGRLPPIRPV
jgi:DNA-binding MarR family transcriptional regulator